ncbi:MAG: UDP-N-acetylmuramate:L-alanyl-gamma-D-glutamyl-meso-diaminopimelate ligase [Pseudomonadota bacterium]|nr:UDP-N-acetylmuramate:L-alanyl-gamma-D-glutamyl-meso-diaminopimelate ligase [Pseudomonadota bacterium]
MSKRVHILGICGTFMGGVALLARELGYEVTGSDVNVYPPMSTMLDTAGIAVQEGYSSEHLKPAPDLVVIGNALSRGNQAVEYVLDQQIPYLSGPQWLGENLLQGRHVAAISGTHGKTTTSSMLTWVLECEGLNPGFLIGGIPCGFEGSARLGQGPFVVEADEYDSAFFDKRSKFVHYKPQTLVVNNLEFDHADIFADLNAIQTQFHHLVRCIPSRGQIIASNSDAIDDVLNRGCWTPVSRLDTGSPDDWSVQARDKHFGEFEISSPAGDRGAIKWGLIGRHNAENALAAVAAAHDIGVSVKDACEALCRFEGVKRRLELLGAPNEIAIYDDFAHHPTAVKTTLEGLRSAAGEQRVVAVIEIRSNTMKRGTHKEELVPATQHADLVFWFEPEGLDWSMTEATSELDGHFVFGDTRQLHDALVGQLHSGDHVVIMSNGSFSGLHRQLLQSLSS